MLDRPSGPMWGEQVKLLGEQGFKKSENKGLIVCWNKGNKRVWLEMSDCLLESGWQGCWACWGNCPKGCLIAPNQY